MFVEEKSFLVVLYNAFRCIFCITQTLSFLGIHNIWFIEYRHWKSEWELGDQIQVG